VLLGTSGKEAHELQDEDVNPSNAWTQELRFRDDLTSIEGIDAEAQQAFYDAGYYSYCDIENASTYDLKRVFAAGNFQFTRRDFESWSGQAALRSAEQNETETSTRSDKNATLKTAREDDLTKIHGIGSATAKLLQKSGITTFRSLHEADPEQLQSILNSGGTKFKLVDPSSWLQQTRFAMSGDWTGLSNWKTTWDVAARDSNDVKEATSNQKSVAAIAPLAIANNLTVIHGLGKASQKVLNENGINSFAQIASMTSQQLDSIFAKKQKQFQLIDTSTWPTQAQQLVGEVSKQQDYSQNLEMELLDEIDSIRDIAASSGTSSASHKRKKASKRS